MSVNLFCPECGAAYEAKDIRCPACGYPLPTEGERSDLHDEVIISHRYQLVNLLGSGGFSAVYRARDLHEGGRLVALKQISLRGLSAEKTIEATETFNREVSTLSTLTHPQVPHLYDHFNDRDHWYLVQEYIEGQTLETYLATREAQRRPLQIEEILSLALQLCQVLEYLHNRKPPLIYRDLKPSNIMRTPNGTLILVDFGIARRFSPGRRRDTQALGSPGYAAPEQYGHAQTTPQTDIYGLGALLHFLLSGQDPADNPHGLLPLRLPQQKGGRDLEGLVTHMLAPDPGQRPVSVRLVAEMLSRIKQQAIAANTSVPIWTPPTPQPSPWISSVPGQQLMQVARPAQSSSVPPLPARRGISRRRALIVLGSLTAAGVSATMGVASLSFFTSKSAPTPVKNSASPIKANYKILYEYQGHTGLVNSVAWSPDGKRIASGSSDFTVQIWDAITGSQVLAYQGHSAVVHSVVWSPDGTRIASGSDDGTTQVWDATTGKTTVTNHNQYSVNSVAWSPDSTRIVSGSSEATVQVWEIL